MLFTKRMNVNMIAVRRQYQLAEEYFVKKRIEARCFSLIIFKIHEHLIMVFVFLIRFIKNALTITEHHNIYVLFQSGL